MFKKAKDGIKSIKNNHDNNATGYRYERLQNVYVGDDGREVRLGFDTIIKLDKNNNVKGFYIEYLVF